MANPTTNFGWVMPTSASLVTNLPADFNVFGQAVDTSMQYLLGGTTGQILSKTSGTNMAFTWIANDQGDITGVTAGNGISGGGTSGTVSVAIDTAITVDKTTAQTLTNKTLTSPALTTPTISTATTNGDILYGTGSGALARLGIGTTGQVLNVSSGIPAWTTASAGALTFITGTTFSAVASFSLPANTFTATYDNYLVRFQLTDASASSAVTLKLRAGGTDTSSGYYSAQYRVDYQLTVTSLGENATTSWGLGSINTGGTNQQIFQYDLNIKQPFNTKHTMVNSAGSLGNIVSSVGLLAKVDTTSYDSLTFACSSGTITGNYRVYGYANS